MPQPRYTAGDLRVAVMVGYAEKASWKMDVPASSRLIDANLKEQLAKIQDSLRGEGGKVDSPVPPSARSRTGTRWWTSALTRS
jgi:hypothetical protein